LEQKWQKAVDENLESASVLFEVIKKHRITFLMAGFVLSFIQIIVGLFLKYMVFRTEIIPDDLNQTFKITYEVDLVGTIFYIITIIFMAIYVTASFYRVRAEDHTTGNRYNYLSSPAQITLLLSYSFVGVNLDFAILWFTQSLNANNAIGFDVVPLDYLTSGLIIPLLLMNLVFFSVAVYASGEIPKLILGSVYRKPTKDQLQNWTMKIIPFIIFVSIMTTFIIRISSNQENSDFINLVHIILLLLPVVIILLISSRFEVFGKTCQTCNLILDKDNFCQACTEGKALPIRINFVSKLQHPYCPSCGTTWSSLSRKCVNSKCNYTILLSCQKCSQTLNPLWDRCNVCGENRKPIPHLALQSQGSPSYARNQAFLMILVAFLIPVMILQITIIANIFSRVRNKIYDESVLLSVNDDIGRAIMLLITIIAIFSIIIASFDDRKRPMMLVANRIATSAGSILILTAFFVLTFFSFTKIFTDGLDGLFVRIFIFIFAILMVTSSIYNYYKSLIQFRPIVGFDPSIAIDKIGG
ncbi:MAG: hypothetical protein HeimC2_13310, partial [Candidatus Heimdallarchaeota archaeon LC_2]